MSIELKPMIGGFYRLPGGKKIGNIEGPALVRLLELEGGLISIQAGEEREVVEKERIVINENERNRE